MYCTKCGAQIPESARFCPSCGAAIEVRAEVRERQVAHQPDNAGNLDAAVAALQQAELQTEVAPPAGVSGSQLPVQKTTKSRTLPIAIIAAALVILALGAVGISALLSRGGQGQDDRTANAATGGAAGTQGDAIAAAPAFDYFVSTRAGGICRADPQSGEVEVIYPFDNESKYVSALAYDDRTIYFALRDYMDAQAPSELHAIKDDGSGDTALYSCDVEVQRGGWSSIDALAVYDGTVYLAVAVSNDANGESYTTFFTMDTDGGNVRACGQTTDTVAQRALVITEDAAYYISNHYDASTSTTTGTLNKLDFKSAENQLLYTGSLNGIDGLGIAGERLYFREYANGRSVIASVALDGSDEQRLYEPPSDHGIAMLAMTGDALYLESYVVDPNVMDITTWNLVRLPIEGSEPQTVASDLDVYNPTAADMGDRLLVSENGQYQGSAGERVISISYDGSQITEYSLD